MKTGSQTNWLRLCDSNADCGELECVCGVCSSGCTTDAQCSELSGASCVEASDPATVAICGGKVAPSSLCLARCEDEPDDSGQHCVGGVLSPVPIPEVRVRVDSEVRYQTLLGIGASLAYGEDEIVAHPRMEELFDVMFTESGFEAVRFRNRYGAEGDDDLTATQLILEAAEQRLGTRPTLFMTSATPPASLKANESRRCGRDPETCTLRNAPNGGFDYAGFASHWRASLEAHADLGIVPDYVSIQNDPDWVPEPMNFVEACRFLPEEGEMMLMRDGAPVTVTYPGYREALDAVRAELSGSASLPALVAPETTGIDLVSDYVDPLPSGSYDGLAYHLYGAEVGAPDPAAFERVRQLGERTGLPIFQTEMRADGLTTAVLMHYSMAVAGASVYLQNDFISSASLEERDPYALITLSEDGFEAQAPYHALSHYARYTERGWTRVAAEAEPVSGGSAAESELLSSAWSSPDGKGLTVVLVNPGTTQLGVVLQLPQALLEEAKASVVERTVFDGVERSAPLGALPQDGVVSVPGGAVVTVSLR